MIVFSCNCSHHLVSHWANMWVIRCLLLAGNFTSAASLLGQMCLNMSPATIAQQRVHQTRASFAPRRSLDGESSVTRQTMCMLHVSLCLTTSSGSASDWLHLFADSDVATEVSLAGAIGCSPLYLSPDDTHAIVGGVPLALQASCMRLVLSLYRSGLYQASSACVRALIGCGSNEAMSIPRPTLDALQSLPCVVDMTVDERAHVLGMSSINAWNRCGFDTFDGHLCHGPPDLYLCSRSFTPTCCAAVASALASNVRITSLFLDGSTLADSGCAAICAGIASNRTLTHLSLCSCKITVDACHALRLLLATPGGPPLLVLDISGNSILDSGAALIGAGLAQAALVDRPRSSSAAASPSRSQHGLADIPSALSLCVLRTSTSSPCVFL